MTNSDGNPHSFHPHLVHFAVLDVDGDAPPARAGGLEGHDLRAARHDRPPHRPLRGPRGSRRTPYMFHCHVLRHEDQGMMGQFVVVEPGDEAGQARPTGDASR